MVNFEKLTQSKICSAFLGISDGPSVSALTNGFDTPEERYQKLKKVKSLHGLKWKLKLLWCSILFVWPTGGKRDGTSLSSCLFVGWNCILKLSWANSEMIKWGWKLAEELWFTFKLPAKWTLVKKIGFILKWREIIFGCTLVMFKCVRLLFSCKIFLSFYSIPWIFCSFSLAFALLNMMTQKKSMLFFYFLFS